MRCTECGRAVRPQGANPLEFPGTILIAAKGMCWACYRPRSKGAESVASVVDLSEEPVVPVRVLLRPSAFRQLLAHADKRDTTVGALLSLLADASLKPKRGA